MIRLELPLKLVSVSNKREHWSVRHSRAKHQRNTVRLALSAAGHAGRFAKAPSARAVVTITRIAPRRLDSHDNLRTSAKAVADGVADYLGVDDRSERIEWRYAQERRRVGEYAVRIELDEFEPVQCTVTEVL